MPEVEPRNGPQWGDRTIRAVTSDPYLTDAYSCVKGVPIIHWIFGFIEMILLRIWLWIHSLQLPGWMEWILHLMDHIIEKVVVVVSWIIRWIFGPREKQSSKMRAAANRHQGRLSSSDK